MELFVAGDDIVKLFKHTCALALFRFICLCDEFVHSLHVLWTPGQEFCLFKVISEAFIGFIESVFIEHVQKGSLLIHRSPGCCVIKPPFNPPITQQREKKCFGSANCIPLRLSVIPQKNLTLIKKETKKRGSLSLLYEGRCQTSLSSCTHITPSSATW